MAEDSKVISVRVPITLHERLQKHVEDDSHLSQGEYIRTLLRQNLEEEK